MPYVGADNEITRRKTTSSYLGWTERKPKGYNDKFDHTYLPSSESTKSYEQYVKGIFKPGHIKCAAQSKQDHGIPASTMLKLERTFGKYALQAYEDEDLAHGRTPMERMYIELGMQSPEMPANIRHYSLFRDSDSEDWKKNNKQQLIDYKDFNSSPLSPYLYQEHPYVRSQDTRIVGSNFVQVTTRPRDRFLDKIDQTLKEVREMPRYT